MLQSPLYSQHVPRALDTEGTGRVYLGVSDMNTSDLLSDLIPDIKQTNAEIAYYGALSSLTFEIATLPASDASIDSLLEVLKTSLIERLGDDISEEALNQVHEQNKAWLARFREDLKGNKQSSI